MGAVGFTTEEKRELEGYFGKEYLMEIFHPVTKRWESDNPVCYTVLVEFMRRLPPDTVESGVGGFISRSVEALAHRRGKRPRAVMEELVVTENPNALRAIFAEMLHATA